jgi:DNA-binding transcriptional regulator GbsR (MarR family)
VADRVDDKKQFTEDLGILFEHMGFPLIAGRIWGWLLVCTPPEQAAEDLATALGASRGSISTMKRMLMQMELIERVGIPGSRKRFYRIKSGGFAQLLQAKARLTAAIRQMSERGLEIMKDEPPEMRQRLEDYREFYAFFEKEFPSLIRKWEQTKKGS